MTAEQMPRRRAASIWIGGLPGVDLHGAMQALCDQPPVRADFSLTDHAQAGACSEVAVDVGYCTLVGCDRVRLLAPASFEHVECHCALITRGALGVVGLIDHAEPEVLSKLNRALDGCTDALASRPMVVGVFNADGEAALEPYRRLLAERGLCGQVQRVDLQRGEQLLWLVEQCYAICTAQPCDRPEAATPTAGDRLRQAVDAMSAVISLARARAGIPS